ncbi:hypothetical protein D3C85_1459150 [compost metagenome]
MLVEDEGVSVVFERRAGQVLRNPFIHHDNGGAYTDFPAFGFGDVFQCLVGHQKHRIAIRLGAGLQPPRPADRVVIVLYFSALHQHAFAIAATEHESCFDDFREDQYGFGLA